MINDLREKIEVNEISSNDIRVLKDIYGIEAGRNAWVREVREVFGYYGIKINPRHMYLVAD